LSAEIAPTTLSWITPPSALANNTMRRSWVMNASPVAGAMLSAVTVPMRLPSGHARAASSAGWQRCGWKASLNPNAFGKMTDRLAVVSSPDAWVTVEMIEGGALGTGVDSSMWATGAKGIGSTPS
jgi:hypothetical protein